ncbi:sulfotransferase family 2 domain-containing protein [Celeribacter persicus]|uniref:Sulfotransferase family protein n=1 Tax=Celeribacter persicus TaxID=1651082 RepID=A0A2T5H3Z0_9RHOB|nr:sulfotransferase family 2 domain-containing protein [Celeribacter persicus]PTQ66229.1 hypothetical protein C8N42_1334 [Celeribacter persicus]
MMIIDAQFLREGSHGPFVPRPHDLLKNERGIARVLPDAIFVSARILYRRISYVIGRKVSPFHLYDSVGAAFIHVPKNAGTFINSVVYPDFSPETSTKINAHHSAQYLLLLDKSAFDAVKKFAILRNPAARLRSAFDYLKFKTPFDTDKAFAEKSLSNFATFEEFCANVDDDTFTELMAWPHFQPQISFICDAHGTLLVNALTVFERMDMGLQNIGNAWGKDWSGIEVNTAPLKTNEAITAIVEKYYASDLRLWKTVNASPEACCLVSRPSSKFLGKMAT